MPMARKWKWGVLFSGDNLTLQETIDFAAKAEDAGAESLWTTELGRDAFVPLAGMAARCKRARLGTGVAVFARPPAMTEISAMSMAELTEGRFVLGLGTAPQGVERELARGFVPAGRFSRMQEYVELDQAACGPRTPTAPIDYEGEIITVRDYRRLIAPPCEPPPIYLAAVQKGMLRLSGEVADGLLANVLNTPHYFTDIVHPNGQGRAFPKPAATRRRHRALRGQDLLGGQGPRAPAPGSGRDPASPSIRWLPYFDQVLDPAGFTREKLAIREAWARADRGRDGRACDRRHDRCAGARRHARRRARTSSTASRGCSRPSCSTAPTPSSSARSRSPTTRR